MSIINNQNPYTNFLQVKTLLHRPAKMSTNPLPDKPIAAINLNSENDESNNFTAAVAGAAIVAAIAGIILSCGGSRKFYKNLNSRLQRVNDKIAEYTKKYDSLNKIQKFGLKVNKGIQKVLGFMNIGNNVTAAKDSAFKWFCEKLHLKKACDFSTAQFKKITVYTSQKSYQRARNVLDSNIPQLKKLKAYIKNPDDAAKFENALNSMEKEILNVTSGENRLARLERTEKQTSDVGNKVLSEIKRIWKSLFKTKAERKEELSKLRLYRTEVHSALGKETLGKELQSAQRKFTFNIDDKTEIMSAAKDDIGRAIKIEDTESRDILREFSKLIKEYKACSGQNEAVERNKVVAKLQDKLALLKSHMLSDLYSKESQVLLNGKFAEIDSILSQTDKRGSIEEILGILNKHIKNNNPKKYFQATNLTTQMRKSVKKAFEDEMKLYEKFAEYSVGSAPTDVLGILLPLGAAGYTISKGQTKDEKISATLNAGIPIIGGVATTIIAAAKMMSNVQGIALGLVTGVVLNALGSKADEKYKEWKDNKLFTLKAIEAYKKSNIS